MTCPTKTRALAYSIIQQMDDIGVWQRDFLLDLFDLWLCLHGRYNFTHLGRYEQRNESTYRENFAKPFDFFSFNFLLVQQHLSDQLIIAFDPSYISKSGKCTDGTGKYWSGVAGKAKWGMEASGIANGPWRFYALFVVLRPKLITLGQAFSIKSGSRSIRHSDNILRA